MRQPHKLQRFHAVNNRSISMLRFCPIIGPQEIKNIGLIHGSFAFMSKKKAASAAFPINHNRNCYRFNFFSISCLFV